MASCCARARVPISSAILYVTRLVGASSSARAARDFSSRTRLDAAIKYLQLPTVSSLTLRRRTGRVGVLVAQICNSRLFNVEVKGEEPKIVDPDKVRGKVLEAMRHGASHAYAVISCGSSCTRPAQWLSLPRFVVCSQAEKELEKKKRLYASMGLLVPLQRDRKRCHGPRQGHSAHSTCRQKTLPENSIRCHCQRTG